MMQPEDPIERDLDPSLSDIVEGAVRKIVTAIVIAGGLVAAGIYWQPSGPHYEVVAADGRIYRINTHNGTVVGCQGERCAIVWDSGHHLDDRLDPPAPPKQTSTPPAVPAGTPAPALPGPAANAPPPAPAPAPATH